MITSELLRLSMQLSTLIPEYTFPYTFLWFGVWAFLIFNPTFLFLPQDCQDSPDAGIVPDKNITKSY